jgi:hypothetical protein
MVLWVEAINRITNLAVLNDGQILPITHWFKDGEKCEAEDATSCVCGPCKSGHWYTVDLSEMDEVMQ